MYAGLTTADKRRGLNYYIKDSLRAEMEKGATK